MIYESYKSSNKTNEIWYLTCYMGPKLILQFYHIKLHLYQFYRYHLILFFTSVRKWRFHLRNIIILKELSGNVNAEQTKDWVRSWIYMLCKKMLTKTPFLRGTTLLFLIRNKYRSYCHVVLSGNIYLHAIIDKGYFLL